MINSCPLSLAGPAAAEGFDERDGDGEAFGADGVGTAFGIETGAFRIHHIEEADEAGFVAFGGEIEGFASGCERLILRWRRRWQQLFAATGRTPSGLSPD